VRVFFGKDTKLLIAAQVPWVTLLDRTCCVKDEVVKSEGGFKGITALRFKSTPVARTRPTAVVDVRFASLDLQLLNYKIKLSERGSGKDYKTLNLR